MEEKNKITEDKKNKKSDIASKLHKMQLNSLRNTASNIERKKTKKGQRSENRRQILKSIFIVIAIIIIILILLILTVVDTKTIIKNYSYSKNIDKLNKKLEKVIEEKGDSYEFDINDLDSTIIRTEDDELEIVDVLSDYKNSYTSKTVAIESGKLVYAGTDKDLKLIAKEKGLEVSYSIYSGVLVDTADFEFEEESGKITKYLGNQKIVYIPSKINDVNVTTIGSYAFESKDIELVILPNSIKEIQYAAFANNNLYYINLPLSLEVIDAYAFYNNELEQIKFNSLLKEIGAFSFASNNLKEIITDASNTKLGYGCFNQNFVEESKAYFYKASPLNDKYELVTYAGNEKNIVIEEGVEKIGNSAFSRNTLGTNYNNIDKVELPDSLKIIGDSAFENNNISTIKIPSSVVFVGKSAFENNNIRK